jgi:hypothetical protein
MRELSKRGNLVAGIAIGLLIAGLVWVSGNVWITEEGRICLGSMLECM